MWFNVNVKIWLMQHHVGHAQHHLIGISWLLCLQTHWSESPVKFMRPTVWGGHYNLTSSQSFINTTPAVLRFFMRLNKDREEIHQRSSNHLAKLKGGRKGRFYVCNANLCATECFVLDAQHRYPLSMIADGCFTTWQIVFVWQCTMSIWTILSEIPVRK